ncbi:unnamed protein product [Lactuca saligna]|uniref:Uncharacterized protein n=1 Tax=Lactuca saligna TaxID=75948 RepID=A0AA35ZJ25_LACSI|nr:unnamed protein product [Lactuca saligna]
MHSNSSNHQQLFATQIDDMIHTFFNSFSNMLLNLVVVISLEDLFQTCLALSSLSWRHDSESLDSDTNRCNGNLGFDKSITNVDLYTQIPTATLPNPLIHSYVNTESRQQYTIQQRIKYWNRWKQNILLVISNQKGSGHSNKGSMGNKNKTKMYFIIIPTSPRQQANQVVCSTEKTRKQEVCLVGDDELTIGRSSYIQINDIKTNGDGDV